MLMYYVHYTYNITPYSLGLLPFISNISIVPPEPNVSVLILKSVILFAGDNMFEQNRASE